MGKAGKKILFHLAAGVVAVMGMFLLGNGTALVGISFPGMHKEAQEAAKSQVTPQVQNIATSLTGGAYEAIHVKKGIPVHWVITARAEDLTGCNQTMYIQQYDILLRLQPGENVVEFTPDQSGTFVYSCWMGMITSTITVE